MVLLEKLWDDVLAGPQPDRGLGKLRKVTTPKPLNLADGGVLEAGEGSSKYLQGSLSMPGTPTPVTPGTPMTPSSAGKKENVWRSVFNPGSNLASRSHGAHVFDKPQPNTPTVYDWLYSDDTRSKHR